MVPDGGGSQGYCWGGPGTLLHAESQGLVVLGGTASVWMLEGGKCKRRAQPGQGLVLVPLPGDVSRNTGCTKQLK